METSYSGKPYFFVPLVKRVDRRKETNRQNLLTSGVLTGKLGVSIKCLTPLHFGSGQLAFDETTERFIHSLIRENGQIALPGSSFKGMLRTVFEAVSASCVLNAPRAFPLKGKVGNLGACTSNSGSCPACSVFGRLSYKGKLTISPFKSDAEPINLNVPTLEQPFRTYPRPARGESDNRTGNERLYYGNFRDVRGLDVARLTKGEFHAHKEREPQSGGNFYGRKFYKHSSSWKTLAERPSKNVCECLPVNATLTGSIGYQGLTEDELGALFFALGLGWEQPILHKLCYAKPAYLGSIELTITPESLPRYEVAPMTTADAGKIAAQYYVKHKPLIEAAVRALEMEWSEIGDSIWPRQDGKYGY